VIVITTPTGQIGRQVLGNLLESGEQLRVITRDPSQLPAEVRNDLDIVEGSHGDTAVVDKAFAGADAVLWLTPADRRAPSVEAAYAGFTRPATEAFNRHGVGRVVGVSMLGRGTPWAGQAGFVTASLAMDDLIAASGVAYRALSPRRNRLARTHTRAGPCQQARPLNPTPDGLRCDWSRPWHRPSNCRGSRRARNPHRSRRHRRRE